MGMLKLKKDVIRAWLKNKTAPPRTIEELAEEAKLEPSSLYMIFKGDREATSNVLRRLCETMGLDVADICFFDRNKEPKES